MKTGYYYVILRNGYTTIGLFTSMGWTYGEYNASISKYGKAPVLSSWHSEFKGFHIKPY
jgi:hypothetical protein